MAWRGVAWRGVAWLALGAAGMASAFNAEIIATDECEGLAYSKLKQSPYRTSAGAQYAEFQLTCMVTDLPPGATVAYQWSPVQTSNPQSPPAGAIWVPSPGTAANTIGWAYVDDSPLGLYTASCTVTVTAPQGGGQTQVMKGFLVVGGPLKLEAKNYLNADGTMHQNFLPTWKHDLTAAEKPHFMQYFNYDPTVPSWFSTAFQRPQVGHVQPRFQQPDIGPDEPIEYHWTVPPGTKVKAKAQPTLEDSTWIELLATQGSGRGGIEPRCQFKVVFNGRTYWVWDDSPESAPENETEPNPDHFRFTAHKPQDTLPNSTEDEEEDCGNTEYPYGWIRRTRPILLDNLGDRMPDVWVQERFQPPVPPPGSNINTSLVWWTTVRGVDDASNGHPAGRFGLGSNENNENGWDNLWLRRENPYTYAQNPASPFYDFSHQYYAANKITTGTMGYFVGSYRIKLWTDRVDHIKE
ncbi:MAG: hypothetical protein IT207_05815 [Fimbriimonadaceae bacterium]|nr:hypothetical protein [Fimbriimonadaceae bacterium]